MVSEAEDWTARARVALGGYSEPLLREVAARLIKPRTNQPVEELIDKSVAALTNPPVIDRRIKDLPQPARKLMALIGLSRQPRWKVGHLITLLASLGHAEGFSPVQAALEAGLLFPELHPGAARISDFAAWLGQVGSLSAITFAHPSVAVRARGEDLELPDLAAGADANEPSPRILPAPASVRIADGLEWPLRLAVVWQQVGAASVRLTQSNTLFKRDQTRFQTDEVLSGQPADYLAPARDPAVLALFWASAIGLLQESEGELRAAPFPAAWDAGLHSVLTQLFIGLPHIEAWDPLAGYAPIENNLSSTPTAAFLALLHLARGWVDPAAIAVWLWDHHPTWAGTLPRDAAHNHGLDWVEGFLLGVAFPLRLVEAAPGAPPGSWVVRLSDLGRHLLAGGPEPTLAPVFPQTLLVQPNAEVLAYRQGLTPALIGTLARFALWKGIGPACTLELNPEQIYRGLESGLTLPMIMHTLNRHGTRPVPATVADLLQRWSNKRERITIYTSAVLVEFPTAADLDSAVARGIVSVRLTDRIGMTPDGKEPSFSQLRLIGNRDYEAKPQKCVTVAPDGVTLTIDAAQADLLLEAEIARFATPVPMETVGVRRFRTDQQSLRRASESGLSLSDIDGWFIERTGAPLSPAGRLFLLGPVLPSPTARRLLVVQFPTPEITDGVMQWPSTAAFVEQRLGPTSVVIHEQHFEGFRRLLAEGGVVIQEG